MATLTALATPTRGWADDSKECIDAHAGGQRFQKEGELRAARSQFTECASEKCPDLVREECVGLLKEVSKLVPSVVLAAVDADGNDLTDVRVEVDGKPLVDRLDGHAVELEPGKHEFRFTAADGREAKKTIVLREGERARPIKVEFGVVSEAVPAARDEPAASEFGHREVAYVLGVVGLMALGGFAYGALSGKSHLDELEETCSPHCSEREVDIPRQEYLLADICLLVAAASLGGGAYLYFYYEPAAEPSSAGLATSRSGADLGGLMVGYGGRF